jgi:sporulation protein YlmC with PRC-barrel domain
MLYLGSTLKGYTVQAPDGKVGTVSDFLFDDRTWKIRWLVIDTGTWLTERRILLPPPALGKPDFEGRAVPVTLTREQVAASPDIRHDQPVSRQMEYSLGGYYGYDPLWGNGAYNLPPTVTPAATEAVGGGAPVAARSGGAPGNVLAPAAGDPHLRSMTEIATYDIHAIDGTIGHLEDCQIDDESWEIRYVIVDTANWWFGKHVVLPPATIVEIDWADRFVKVDLTCYKIKGSPPWEGTGLIDRAYEGLLHLYYGLPSVAPVAASSRGDADKATHPVAPS